MQPFYSKWNTATLNNFQIQYIGILWRATKCIVLVLGLIQSILFSCIIVLFWPSCRDNLWHLTKMSLVSSVLFHNKHISILSIVLNEETCCSCTICVDMCCDYLSKHVCAKVTKILSRRFIDLVVFSTSCPDLQYISSRCADITKQHNVPYLKLQTLMC